jgi:transposase-like protein
MANETPAKKTPSPEGGSHTSQTLTPEARQRIIDAYEAGVSINGIAATFGHGRTTVRKVLRGSDVQLRDDACRPKMSRAELIQRHAEGWTTKQIADACGATIGTINQRLADLDLPSGDVPPKLPVEEIRAAHQKGKSVRSLANRYGVHRETIARILAAGGVAPSSSRTVISPLKLADLCRRGLTVAEMSKATGLYRKTLRKHLVAAGLEAADKRPGRERPAVVPEAFLGAGR